MVYCAGTLSAPMPAKWCACECLSSMRIECDHKTVQRIIGANKLNLPHLLPSTICFGWHGGRCGPLPIRVPIKCTMLWPARRRSRSKIYAIHNVCAEFAAFARVFMTRSMDKHLVLAAALGLGSCRMCICPFCAMRHKLRSLEKGEKIAFFVVFSSAKEKKSSAKKANSSTLFIARSWFFFRLFKLDPIKLR